MSRAGLILLILALLALGCQQLARHFIGVGEERADARQRDAVAEQYRESVRIGSGLAARAREEAQQARIYAAQLLQEKDRETTPLVQCPDLADAASAPAGQQGAADGSGLRLSAGAVRLWDNALAGAELPADTCGTAGAAAGACAAASAPATVDDAWANHIENSARWLEGRSRHQRLLDYLQAREAAAGR